MANRRMFAKAIIESDAFLELTPWSQLLYFHLAMAADDDGFVNRPKTLMRMVGGRDRDLQALVDGKFLIPFPSGVVVITHWKIHNYIRKDTYCPTKFCQELAALEVDETAAYRLVTGSSQVRDEPVTDPSTQDRIGKDRLGKVRLGKDRVGEGSREGAASDSAVRSRPSRPKGFQPPELEEVIGYCLQRGNGMNAQQFYDHYTSNGWMVGKTKMKDWQAAVRTWEQRDSKWGAKPPPPKGENPFLAILEEDRYD